MGGVTVAMASALVNDSNPIVTRQARRVVADSVVTVKAVVSVVVNWSHVVRGCGSDRVGYFFSFIVPWVLSSSSGFGLAGPPLCLPVPKNPSVKSAYNEFFRLIVLLWAPK